MHHCRKYLSFWKNIFNQISYFYNELSFDIFIENPWVYIARLADESCSDGLLQAYINQKVYLTSNDLPQLEPVLDLGEMALIAQELLKPVESLRDQQENYRIH